MRAAASNELSNPTTLATRATGQLCDVSFCTIIRWIERGEPPGYHLPQRGDHQISAVELRTSMRKHGMVASEVDGTVQRVLFAAHRCAATGRRSRSAHIRAIGDVHGPRVVLTTADNPT
jgi:hypothetical protein